MGIKQPLSEEYLSMQEQLLKKAEGVKSTYSYWQFMQ